MQVTKLNVLLGVLVLILGSCKEDDDTTSPVVVPIRDRGIQAAADDAHLIEFFKTHYYTYSAKSSSDTAVHPKITIDSLDANNKDKESLYTELGKRLVAKTVTIAGVDQTAYVLSLREGVGETSSFADSVLVNYQGMILDEVKKHSGSEDSSFRIGKLFDSSATPVWFNLPSVVIGFALGLDGAKSGSGFSIDPDDGSWNLKNDSAEGVVFLPSGLGYFEGSASGAIGSYKSLYFTFSLVAVRVTDHDGDGTLSKDEDSNNNKYLFDDNADGDRFPDFLDKDTK